MRTPQNNFSKNLATPHRNNSAARLVIKTFRQNVWQFPFLSVYFDHFFLVSLIDRLGKPQKRRVNESTNEWKWEEKSRFFLPTLPNRFTLTWTERKFKTSSNTFTFRSLIRMQMRLETTKFRAESSVADSPKTTLSACGVLIWMKRVAESSRKVRRVFSLQMWVVWHKECVFVTNIYTKFPVWRLFTFVATGPWKQI